MKDLSLKLLSTLTVEAEEDTKKGKDHLHPWIDKINMTILLKEIYRSNAISINIPMAFYTEIEN